MLAWSVSLPMNQVITPRGRLLVYLAVNSQWWRGTEVGTCNRKDRNGSSSTFSICPKSQISKTSQESSEKYYNVLRSYNARRKSTKCAAVCGGAFTESGIHSLRNSEFVNRCSIFILGLSYQLDNAGGVPVIEHGLIDVAFAEIEPNAISLEERGFPN